jgi:hypothetical protein
MVVNSTSTATSNEILNQALKPPALYAQLAYGTAHCVKRFGLGVATGALLITPLTEGLSYLAQVSGLIPKWRYADNIKKVVTNMQNAGFYKFNVESLLSATCYLDEYVKQYNSHFPSNMTHSHLTSSGIKAIYFKEWVLIAPLKEESIFRLALQYVLLTRTLKYIAGKIAPEKEKMFDSSIFKAVRIAITAAAFSAFHLQNQGVFSDAYVTMQLVATFVLGIGLGILQESEAGFLGSVGAHMAINFVAGLGILCNLKLSWRQ